MHRRKISLIVITLAACVTGDHPDEDDFPPVNTFGTDSSNGTGTEGDTEITAEPGSLWCARRASATYEHPVEGTKDVEYSGGGAPEGCVCVDQITSDGLEAKEVNGQVPSDDLVTQDEFDVEAAIHGQAKVECEALVPGAYENNCDENESLDFDPGTMGIQLPPLYQGREEDEEAGDGEEGDVDCAVVRMYEELPGSGTCSFIDGSYGSEITWNSTYSRWDIDETLFDNLLAVPGCLLHEGGRVDVSGSRYVLTGISNDELLDELQLQNGDEPLYINSMRLDSVDYAFRAFDSLQRTDTLTLQVKRAGNTVTIVYHVDR